MEVVRRLPHPGWPTWAAWAYLSISLTTMVVLYEALWVVVQLPWRTSGNLQSILGTTVAAIAEAGLLLSIPIVLLFTATVHRGSPELSS